DGGDGALAGTQYDAYRAAFDVAAANVGVGNAAIVQAKATVTQYEAAFKRVERNLSYCTIKSPVKGVIIDRRVNIGQTVVASLNAPSLFLIAKDLTRIQVWVAVNEADISSIHPGQAVTFTVDGIPNRTFVGQVGKTRLNAQMTQNVVTYTVEVNTNNLDGKLLPYMTANVQFDTGRRTDVLLVPNAALRWTPRLELVAPDYRAEAEKILARAGRTGRATSRPDRADAGAGTGISTRPDHPRHGGSPTTGQDQPTGRGVVWVEVSPALVKPIRVTTGLTDGALTEISGGELAEGARVVVSEAMPGAASAGGGPAVGGGGSPFAPQMPSRRPANAGSGTGSGGAPGGAGGGRPGGQ
ncbi:MAG: efflux RND transporter periplasmic adaptor subunit, partial [Phycisphaerae bacterium]|nr:efflux RND transporter periplasmic adaptor subunit [Phycisphaerae bacterium]